MNKKSVTILMGPSSSGKTFEAKKYHRPASSYIISADDVKFELYGREGRWYANHGTFQEIIRRLKKVLPMKSEWSYDIYLDYPFLTRQSRQQVYKAIKQSNIPCDIYINVYQPPLEVCLERNKRRDIPLQNKTIIRQFKHLQDPRREIPDEHILYFHDHHPDIILESWIKPTLLHEIQSNMLHAKRNRKHHTELYNRCCKVLAKIATEGGDGLDPFDVQLIECNAVGPDSSINNNNGSDSICEHVLLLATMGIVKEQNRKRTEILQHARDAINESPWRQLGRLFSRKAKVKT